MISGVFSLHYMPLKMKVLQYSLLSPVDASMDRRGADFSDVDVSNPEVVDGIAGGPVLPGLGDLDFTQNLCPTPAWLLFTF